MEKDSIEILSIENLAELGILDEAFDLYQRLFEIMDIAYLEAQKATPYKTIYPSSFEGLCNKPIKAFVKKHRHLFVFMNGYHEFYIHGVNIRGFAMYYYKKEKPLTLRCFQISFSEFLVRLERVAMGALFDRIIKEKPKADYDYVYRIVAERLEKLVETEKEKRVLRAPKAEEVSIILESTVPVWVYGNTNNINCVQYSHGLRNRTLCIPLLDNEQFVNLPVRYCIDCKKHFVSEQTISAFEDKYGRMLLRKLRESVSKNMTFLALLKNQNFTVGVIT